MDLFKSKGMIIVLVILLGFTIINSINTKKFDESNKKLESNAIAMNVK